MADLALSTVDEDLLIQNESLSVIDGNDDYLQNMSIRLQFFRGDWFLDLREGIPYYESVFLKNPDLVLIRDIFREAIVETNGTEEILKFDMPFDTTTRKLSLSFTVQKTSGEIVDFDQEFLIGEV